MEKSNGDNKKIVVSELTHINLSNLKKIYKITSMDRLINELINYKNNDSKKFGFDNDDLKKDLIDVRGKLDARLDGIYKRLGKYNELYFGRILEMNDKVDDLLKMLEKKDSNENSKNAKSNKIPNVVISTEKETPGKDEKLIESHRILEKENEKLQEKLNLLQSKFQSNKNPFSSKFEAVITKDEFDKIFE